MQAARINISVPDDLKARMDAADINWSATATKAFELELGRLADSKRQKDLTDVVQRLRASKITTSDDDYEMGYAQGERWASNRASYGGLEGLARWREGFGRDWPKISLNHAQIAQFAWAQEELMPQDVDQFWEFEVGADDTQVTRDSYLRGFVAGAVALYGEVAPEL